MTRFTTAPGIVESNFWNISACQDLQQYEELAGFLLGCVFTTMGLTCFSGKRTGKVLTAIEGRTLVPEAAVVKDRAFGTCRAYLSECGRKLLNTWGKGKIAEIFETVPRFIAIATLVRPTSLSRSHDAVEFF